MIGTARFDNSMILQVMYTPSNTQYMYSIKVDDHVPLALLAKEVLELFVRGVVHTGGDGEERLRGVMGAVGTGLHSSPYHRVGRIEDF